MIVFLRRLSTIGSSAILLLSVFISACGGSPMAPPPPPPPPPPPANNPPGVSWIAIQGSRPKEPPNFADLSESVGVRAEVRDDETPVSQLQFIWSAPIGTFTGSGASVTWQAPSQGTTPTDVTLRL